MCIWDSHVYQKGVLCFLIHKSYVRSIEKYCFVRKYAAIPVQLEIIIIIIITIILNEVLCFKLFYVNKYFNNIKQCK